MLEEALSYLARGWSAIPGHTLTEDYLCSCQQGADCDRPGKHPRVNWKQFQSRLPTESELRLWWGRWPDANVIIITGKISKLLVIDVDPRHGGDESWRDWSRRYLPNRPVVTSLTGGGGEHWFFEHPMGEDEYPPAANVLPGVDLRADAAYVVAPPSIHETMNRYEWDSTRHPDDVDLYVAPDALIELIEQAARAAKGGSAEQEPLDIEGIVDGRTPIHEGDRNSTMARVAGYFCGKVDNLNTVLMVMDNINQKACDPPMSEQELDRTVKSIWRREQTKRKASSVVAGESGLPEITQGELASDPLAVASRAFADMGVPAVTDWYQLQGDHVEYVLVTPEDEVHFPDLLDHEGVRHVLLNRLGILVQRESKQSTTKADRRAQILRQVARVVIVEPTKASDRVADWLDAYKQRSEPREVPPEEQREAVRQGAVLVSGMLHVNVSQFARFIEAQFGETYKAMEMKRMLRRAGWESAPGFNGVVFRQLPQHVDTQEEMELVEA